MTITYLAGPMTGLPEFNYPQFHEVANELRARRLTVVNPAENDTGAFDVAFGKPWEYYMRLALRGLTVCDEVCLLPGWQDSRGARLERLVAEALGMRVWRWEAAA